MSVAYVNGRYVHRSSAQVSIDDRGFQFGDSVYEVIPFVQGRLVDEEGHLQRLERSINELSMSLPVSMPVLQSLCREVLRKNGVSASKVIDGILYMQVTRCVAVRNHVPPAGPLKSNLLITWKRMQFSSQSSPIHVYSSKDIRWGRCDIKTTNLLPNCLSKTEAYSKGGQETWMIGENGLVSEGGSSNAWIVKDDTIITRHVDHGILNGVTRSTILKLAKEKGLKIEERSFSIDEAYHADEAFGTSAGLMVTPVEKIDDIPIGGGDSTKWEIVPYLQRLYSESIKGMETIWA